MEFKPQRLDKDHYMVPVEQKGKSVQSLIFRFNKAKSPIASRIKPGKDELKKYYKDKNAIEPFVKVAVLNAFAASSSIHSICLRRKSRVVAGLGIKPVTKAPERKYRTTVKKWERALKEQQQPQAQFDVNAGDQAQTPKPKKSLPEVEGVTEEDYNKAKAELDKIEKEKDALQEWLNRAGGDITIREVLERGWYDYENLGWGSFEVLRNGKGEPTTLIHAPSHLVRMAKDHERYLYLKSSINVTWFKRYGDKRSLNSETGEWSKGTLPDSKAANEMLFFHQYSPLDLNYGVPAWYAALAEILGASESRDFMLNFFTRRATPQYAVIFSGGSWSATSLDTVQEFFKNDIARNYQSVLALETPGKDGKIEFREITTEPKGAILVQKYQDSLRDAIVSSHGLFPAIVGIIETAHLGSGGQGEQMDLLKSVEIRPSQETLENILNRAFVWSAPKDEVDENYQLGGLGYDTQMIKLDEIDLYDEKAEASIVSSLYTNAQNPVMTPNEARKRLRLDPVDEELADELLSRGTQGNTVPLQDAGEPPPQPPQQMPQDYFGGQQPPQDQAQQ